jgi:two-component system, NtrC family, sensor histidine kinase PilS
MTWPKSARRAAKELPDSYWRSLLYFNIYRLIAALILGLLGVGLKDFVPQQVGLFLWAASLSAITAVGGIAATLARRPQFPLQLGFAVIADVLLVVTMTYATGGIKNGLGLLLLVTLAAGGLISRGRLALFYAALATIAVLLEETLQLWQNPSERPEYLHTGLLSVGYFAVAWLAHELAQYTRESEQLAEQRGVDLANLAQVNELILRAMADGVIVADAHGRIRARNAKTEELLGPMPLSGDGARLKEFSPELAEWLTGWRANPTNRFMIMRSPVSIKQMRVRFVPIGEGDAHGTVIFLEDLTREQVQARQIKLAALGRLTGSIAHEIRNPLASISHASELLQEEEIDDTGRKLVRIIRDNVTRLDRMVREVLELNRRDRAKPEEIESSEYLRNFVEELQRVERAEPELFSLELNTDAKLYVDSHHLHQVLWNLTRNALRHCRRQPGSIRICLSRSPVPNMLQLDVMDDGPGVSADKLAQLFEPFFTTESQGTGLGLYIARELCEANGGVLDYVEVSPGAHFRVMLRSAP